MRILIVIGALGMLSACASGPSISISESVDDLRAAVNAYPQDFIAHYNLGVALLTEKQYDEALASFKTATEIYPTLDIAYFGMYCASFAKEDALYEEAINEVSSEESQKKIDAAYSYLEQAFAYYPFFDWKLSTILLDGPPKGLSYIEREIYNELNNYFFGGFREFALGNYQKAEKNLTHTIKVLPEYLQANFVRGLARAQLKKYDEAIEDFQYIIQEIEEFKKNQVVPIDVNTAELHFIIGHAFLAKGDYEAAEQSFKRSITQQLGFYMAHVQLSKIYVERGDYTRAMTELNTALLSRPDDATVLIEQGALYMKVEQFEKAASSFEKAVSLKPRYAVGYINHAIAMENMGDTERATKSYNAFLDHASPLRYSKQIAFAKSRLNQ